jgi:phosphoribosylformylglycinamidine cyclo-ligase
MSEPLSYRDAGVDIDEAQRALRAIQKSVQMTHSPEVVGGVGGFGGLFQANFEDIAKPLLVSSIDGIGTKTKVAAMVGEFGGLGKDIVHHCVNDILCQGAKPLFFLDYYGCSKFAGLQFEEILHGMSEACRDLNISLIGGETAEMPGVYHDDEIDIVGSIIGVVDAERKLPRGKMKPGDIIVGLESDGLHTNGFSLARRALFEQSGMSVRDPLPETDQTIGAALVAPHRCYFKAVYPLMQSESGIFAAAHITGGGLYDNPPRVMPSDVRAVFEKRSWTVPPIFKLIQAAGRIPEQEMYRAFNMGIGFILFVDRFAVERVVSALNEAGERAHVIGELSSGSQDIQII